MQYGNTINWFCLRTARLWNSLPVECFPLTYDLDGFWSLEFRSTFNLRTLSNHFSYTLVSPSFSCCSPFSFFFCFQGCYVLYGMNLILKKYIEMFLNLIFVTTYRLLLSFSINKLMTKKITQKIDLFSKTWTAILWIWNWFYEKELNLCSIGISASKSNTKRQACVQL